MTIHPTISACQPYMDAIIASRNGVIRPTALVRQSQSSGHYVEPLASLGAEPVGVFPPRLCDRLGTGRRPRPAPTVEQTDALAVDNLRRATARSSDPSWVPERARAVLVRFDERSAHYAKLLTPEHTAGEGSSRGQ